LAWQQSTPVINATFEQKDWRQRFIINHPFGNERNRLVRTFVPTQVA
jgi:hypothetical protein